MDIERRHSIELRSEGKTLSGYAAVFATDSQDLGGFSERILAGAFARSLAAAPDVVALYDHDRRAILGRTKSGTLRLKEDQRGLKFEIDAPNTTVGRDVLEMVGRGDVTGASFAFTAKEQRWIETPNGLQRELIDVDLHDVTITPSPAYLDTEVARRSMPGTCTFQAYAERQLKILEMFR